MFLVYLVVLISGILDAFLSYAFVPFCLAGSARAYNLV